VRRAPSTVAAAALLLTLVLGACGGGGSDASAPPSTTPGAAGTSTSTTAKTANESSADGSQASDGAVLVPGPVPAAWAKASGGRAITLAKVVPSGAASSEVPCPASVPTVAGRSATCTAYIDAGGPYVSVRSHNAAGIQQTTLYCQKGTGPEFTPSRTITGRVAATPKGIGTDKGRSFGAVAVESADGVHWYAFRRTAGEGCPMVWGLGIDDGTLAVKPAGASASFPLLGGRTCVAAVTKGLEVTKATKAGVCG